MTKESLKKRKHDDNVDDAVPQTLPTSDNVEAEEFEIPDELVHDEEDRVFLIGLRELDREMELADRAEKRRRETERQKLIPEQNLENSQSISEEQTDLEDEKEISQPGTPSRIKSDSQGADSASEKETEDSDSDVKEVVANEAEFADYLSAQIFRSDLERWLNEPHFEESVPGCFVRFHSNEAAKLDRNRCEYLMVEIVDCQAKEDATPYQFGIGDKFTKMQIQLRRGGSEFWSNLNVISNAPFTTKEFEDWVQACKRHNRPLPSKMDLEDRKDQIDQARKFVFTHDEVKKILEEKRKQGSLKMSNVMKRAHLMRLRDFHLDREEFQKVQEYEAQIKELEAKAEAVRKSRSFRSVDKQSTARDKQLKAENLEALIEKRRPRVIEKFQRKLEKLPTERRPMAFLKFYGSSHPLCMNIQESEAKRPFLQRSPSPEFKPSLPQDFMIKPDLERDFTNSSFYNCITVQGKRLKSHEGDALMCGLVSKKDQKAEDKKFGERFLKGYTPIIDTWNQELQSKIESGEISLIQSPK